MKILYIQIVGALIWAISNLKIQSNFLIADPTEIIYKVILKLILIKILLSFIKTSLCEKMTTWECPCFQLQEI